MALTDEDDMAAALLYNILLIGYIRRRQILYADRVGSILG